MTLRKIQSTFVWAGGGFLNIGDAIIRRLAWDLVRDPGGTTVYCGDAPDMWLAQIHATSKDRVIHGRKNFWKFAFDILSAPSRSIVMLEPGEVVLDRASLRREMGLLAVLAVVRLRRGIVILPPRAIARPTKTTMRVHRQLCRIATLVYWREGSSLDRMGIGKLAPDLAFGAGSRPGRKHENRDYVVVSLRGDREVPTDKWCRAIRSFVSQRNFDIRVLSQVEDDEGRNVALAKRLGGQMIDWSKEGALEQEKRVREVYDGAAVVVSDRLHVLIMASLSGAVPAEVVSSPARKIRAHFEQIGFPNASIDTSSMSEDEIVTFLDTQLSRHDEIIGRIVDAQSDLDGVKIEIEKLIDGARASR